MKSILAFAVLVTITLTVPAFACPNCGSNKPMPVDANSEVTQSDAGGFNSSIFALAGGVIAMAGLVGFTVYNAARQT